MNCCCTAVYYSGKLRPNRIWPVRPVSGQYCFWRWDSSATFNVTNVCEESFCLHVSQRRRTQFCINVPGCLRCLKFSSSKLPVSLGFEFGIAIGPLLSRHIFDTVNYITFFVGVGVNNNVLDSCCHQHKRYMHILCPLLSCTTPVSLLFPYQSTQMEA